MSVKDQTVELAILEPVFRLDGEQLRSLVYEGGKTLRSVTIRWRGTFSKKEATWSVTLPSGQQILVDASEPLPLATPVSFIGRLEIPEESRPVTGPLMIEEVSAATP